MDCCLIDLLSIPLLEGNGVIISHVRSALQVLRCHNFLKAAISWVLGGSLVRKDQRRALLRPCVSVSLVYGFRRVELESSAVPNRSW